MGMFDDIAYEAPCPICGTPLTGWQSKDAGCGLDHLTPAQLWEQSAGTRAGENRNNGYDAKGFTEFYQDCGKCGTWVEIRLSPGLLDLTEDDFRKIRERVPFERRSGPLIPEPESQRTDGPRDDEPADPHAGGLWANELERRTRQVAPGEWS